MHITNHDNFTNMIPIGIDSTFDSVPYATTLRSGGPYPDILLDSTFRTQQAWS
jgi:hypothetical protein